jgi:hypothetical protein
VGVHLPRRALNPPEFSRLGDVSLSEAEGLNVGLLRRVIHLLPKFLDLPISILI